MLPITNTHESVLHLERAPQNMSTLARKNALHVNALKQHRAPMINITISHICFIPRACVVFFIARACVVRALRHAAQAPLSTRHYLNLTTTRTGVQDNINLSIYRSNYLSISTIYLCRAKGQEDRTGRVLRCPVDSHW
jgi:hypothetical protein